MCSLHVTPFLLPNTPSKRNIHAVPVRLNTWSTSHQVPSLLRIRSCPRQTLKTRTCLYRTSNRRKRSPNQSRIRIDTSHLTALRTPQIWKRCGHHAASAIGTHGHRYESTTSRKLSNQLRHQSRRHTHPCPNNLYYCVNGRDGSSRPPQPGNTIAPHSLTPHPRRHFLM